MEDQHDPAQPPFDLDRFTPYRLSVAAERASEGLARLYRSRFGISVAEWRVLAHLEHSGNVSVRDIEARVALEKSKVSRAATRLEAAGYIAKAVDPADRRLVQLSLTEEGRALMAEILPVALGFQAELEARLGAAFDGLEQGLQKLLDGTEDKDDPSA
ncbi:MarR family winged helix-turn-helix transcriptional regulator [Mangrovicoccus ximenensis]|uniref:MarR family winged helix-turn-helix transcriptional regulator n=1 Tax=Mangrovicoccus ximenensis TaxID=1911570 RepID=UPI000D358E39|nr:MarR family winged helix-turn-helix transcriptional regulator [Mangrovicoccus ximenensis]